MSRSTNDEVVLGRSIRAHVLNWQDRRGPGTTPTGARKELFAASAELTVLIHRVYPKKPVVEQGEIESLISGSSDPVVVAVRELHAPEEPPAGTVWVSGGAQPKCAGCSSGDPFDSPDWPCATLEAVAAAIK